MKIKLLFFIALLFLSQSCKQVPKNYNNASSKVALHTTSPSHIDELLKRLNNSKDSNVMVISHRGDWRNAPENSLQAIKNCIAMGVDMVEIDVRKTKDGKLILMHDKTLDRTTTGKGFVSDWTLDSIKKLKLRNGTGRPTHHQIPTLREALLIAKDSILINLDKCYNYFEEAYKIIQQTGTTKQVVIKGYKKTVQEVKKDFGSKLDSIIFMPIINLDKQLNAYQIIKDYQSKMKPLAFEMVFSKDTSSVLNKFSEVKRKGSKVWVNSLWKSLNAGYEDDEAVKNTEKIYGWYIKKGVNMIQTDRPQLLLNYLRSKNLHD